MYRRYYAVSKKGKTSAVWYPSLCTPRDASLCARRGHKRRHLTATRTFFRAFVAILPCGLSGAVFDHASAVGARVRARGSSGDAASPHTAASLQPPAVRYTVGGASPAVRASARQTVKVSAPRCAHNRRESTQRSRCTTCSIRYIDPLMRYIDPLKCNFWFQRICSVKSSCVSIMGTWVIPELFPRLGSGVWFAAQFVCGNVLGDD